MPERELTDEEKQLLAPGNDPMGRALREAADRRAARDAAQQLVEAFGSGSPAQRLDRIEAVLRKLIRGPNA